MLEFDDQFTDPIVNRIVKTQKIQKQAQQISDGFDDYFNLLSTEVPSGSLSKRDTSAASAIESERTFDEFGFDALGSLTKSYTTPARTTTLDIDALLKSASDDDRLALRLMKVHSEKNKNFSKSTGTVREEMESFFENYQHLFNAAMKSSIQMAIKCLDFPLFIRLMSSGLAMKGQ